MLVKKLKAFGASLIWIIPNVEIIVIVLVILDLMSKMTLDFIYMFISDSILLLYYL